MIEKILSIPTLNKATIHIQKLRKEDFQKINGLNDNLKSLKINWNGNENKCILKNLQNKFPFLSKIEVVYENLNIYKDFKIILNENQNCKINQIHIDAGITGVINLNIHSYEKMESIDICLNADYDIENIKLALPMLNDNCDKIFENLKYFRFALSVRDSFDVTLIKNLYNNLDKMPNIQVIIITVIQS